MRIAKCWLPHSDLLSELTNQGINPEVIKIVPDINSAFDLVYTTPSTVILKEVKTFITGPEFFKSVLIDEAKSLLMKFMPYKSFESEEVGFPSTYESPTIDSFDEDFEFAVSSVDILSDNEIGIKLNVSVTCLFDIFIFKSDLWCMTEDTPSVYDYDWNEQYVAAQKEKKVWFIMDLIVDSKLVSVQNCDIEIDEKSNSESLLKHINADL